MNSGMLISPGPVRVLMATKPVDFRKGMAGLAALVQEQLKADPFSGVIFCFRAKRADRVKLIFWDGTGLCLFSKRLEGGKFRWPRIEDGVMRRSPAQLAALIEGLDWVRVRARRVGVPEAVQTIASTTPCHGVRAPTTAARCLSRSGASHTGASVKTAVKGRVLKER